MSYNVDNLFDAKHDVIKGVDKSDWAFLPRNAKGKREACLKESSKKRRNECLKSDWTPKKVELKISQIVEVVKARNNSLPDFLGVIEVENSNVVTLLAKRLGYEQFEMTNSPDPRGLNLALLFKKSKLIKKISRDELVVNSEYPTRNILEVQFLIDEKYPLVVFVNHWPSQHNPDSSRVQAAETLKKRVVELQKKTPLINIIAMGDFNTVDSNNPHPFKTVLYQDNLLSDVGQNFVDDKKINGSPKNNMPLGTYYFAPEKTWSMLDHFFVNQSLLKNNDFKINMASFEIFAPSFIKKEVRLKKKNSHHKKNEDQGRDVIFIPKTFNFEAKSKDKMGYSDHFPISVKIEYLEAKKLIKEIKTGKKASKN